MGLSRQRGHVGSVVVIGELAGVQGVSGGEGAAGGKRFTNRVCW